MFEAIVLDARDADESTLGNFFSRSEAENAIQEYISDHPGMVKNFRIEERA